MIKQKEERELLPLEETNLDDVSDLWWDERTKVSMMTDKHLDNALNKLMGLSGNSYIGSDELRRKWISILSIEVIRRRRERLATKIS